MADSSEPGILIVDDHPDVLALLQTVLRHYGFNVWLAPGGPQAAEIYRTNWERIAAVLIESSMSEWDGPRTLEALRAVNPKVVAGFTVGEDAKYTVTDLFELGAGHVIRKPFEPADLAQVLWQMVRAGAGDRRSKPRYPKQSTRVTVGEGLVPAQVVESWLSDLSPDGLRLRLEKKLGDVGAILSIRPADAADGAPWVPVQVRHCGQEEGGWTIGCRFIYPPSARPPRFAS